VTDKFRLSISIQKRILLHLSEYIDSRDSFEVASAVTQQGIADAIGIRLEHVSRSLKRLVHEEYIHKRSAHIKGDYRRKKAYFLSNRGMRYAQEINDEYKPKKLLIRTTEGELREIKFSKLDTFLDFKIKLLEIYRYSSLSKNGIIDLKQIISDKRKVDSTIGLGSDKRTIEISSSKGYIISPITPTINFFYGRQAELRKIDELFNSNINIINIQGIAGIGKTTLISQFVNTLKGKTNIFWYQFELWSSIKDVLEALGNFLNKMGKNELYLYLKSNQTFELGEVIQILATELEEINAILVFDDFQRSDKHTLEFFMTLKNLGKRASIPQIVIISRSRPKFYDKRDVSIDKIVGEIQLSGLDIENSKKLLKGINIDNERFEKIYQISKGHPVALRLVSSSKSIEHLTDFQSFIEDEIFSELDEFEKNLLNAACVFRYPVEAHGLFIEDIQTNFDTLSILEKRLLIFKTPYNTYLMNEVLVDIYYSRLTAKRKQEYHQHAAKYYEKRTSDIEIMERIHHLIQSDQFKIGSELVIEFGERIISRGYSEFPILLDKFPKDKISPTAYKELLDLKTDSLTRFGAWDDALNHCITQLEELPKDKSKETMAQLYGQMGEIYNRKGDFEKTLEYYLKSLKIFEKKKNKKEMARVNNNLGLIYRQKADYKTSLKMYNKSLKLFLELSDPIGITISYLNLGKTYEYMGRFKSALNYYNKSIENSVKNGSNRGLAMSNKFLGMFYFSTDNLPKAEKYLYGSLECLNKEKRKEDLPFICETLSDVHYRKNELDLAIQVLLTGANYLEENISSENGSAKLSIFRKFKLNRMKAKAPNDLTDQFKFENSIESMNIIKFYETIGNIYQQQLKFTDAIIYHKKQLNHAIELDDNLEVAKAFLNLGIDNRKIESFDEAINSYNSALDKLLILNDMIGISTVHRNLGKIFELTGDLEKALEHYEQSLEQSKTGQYDFGIAKALKAIGKVYLKQGDKRKGNLYLKKGMRLWDSIKDQRSS
jgi:tetratricopeptide (TPR) repeat protein